uniref:Putative pirin n=1 Tax=Helianthus annuus TaxID=4232 RepID=A0A251RT43_HELAN
MVADYGGRRLLDCCRWVMLFVGSAGTQERESGREFLKVGLGPPLVGGEPIGQPVVQWGPFVMNTQEEIDQTIQDFENFENGFEKARYWRSEATQDQEF